MLAGAGSLICTPCICGVSLIPSLAERQRLHRACLWWWCVPVWWAPHSHMSNCDPPPLIATCRPWLRCRC